MRVSDYRQHKRHYRQNKVDDPEQSGFLMRLQSTDIETLLTAFSAVALNMD